MPGIPSGAQLNWMTVSLRLAQLPDGARTTATFGGDGKRRSHADTGHRGFIWDGNNVIRQTNRDAAGNRLTQERSGVVTTYSYDAANQLSFEETPSVRTTFSYDANGNLEVQQEAGGRITYSWDLENMCTGLVLANGSRNTFSYGGDLKRRYARDSGGERVFVHDGENVGLELDQTGALVAAYTLEPAGYGNLISERRTSVGTSAWYLYDAVGTAERLVGPLQATIISFVHTAFGVPEAIGGPYPTYPTRYRWLGRYGYRGEPDTSQYDVRRRRYDPSRGRWVSRDVLLGVNRFFYAWNSPMVFVDPSGLVPTGTDPVTDATLVARWIAIRGYLAQKGGQAAVTAGTAAESGLSLLGTAASLLGPVVLLLTDEGNIVSQEEEDAAVRRYYRDHPQPPKSRSDKCRCRQAHPLWEACREADKYRSAQPGAFLFSAALSEPDDPRRADPIDREHYYADDPRFERTIERKNAKTWSPAQRCADGKMYPIRVTAIPKRYPYTFLWETSFEATFTVIQCPCCTDDDRESSFCYNWHGSHIQPD